MTPDTDKGRWAVTIPFRLVAGHVVASLSGSQVLLDTGSPVSFGRVETLDLLGARHGLAGNAQRLSIEDVAAEIRALEGGPGDGFELDALLGCDLLAGCAVDIDWLAGSIRIEPKGASPHTGDSLSCIPRMRLAVEGREATAIVDTGAWFSYVRSECVPDRRPSTRRRDFMPFFGRFEVEFAPGTVIIGGRPLDASLGLAPPPVAAALQLFGASAIVGTDLLARLGVTRFRFDESPARAECRMP